MIPSSLFFSIVTANAGCVMGRFLLSLPSTEPTSARLFPPNAYMTTVNDDSSETTSPVEPPSSPDSQPEEATETTEELKEKLAAAENEVKSWKGRAEKANKKKDDRSDEIKDLEWRLDNKERIKLVQPEYDKLLEEGYEGEKVSKKIALELAEKLAKVDSSDTKRSRQDDMTVPSVTARNVNPKGYTSEIDRALGMTAEKKKKLEEKHPHLLET